jgi:hypothetical protein
LARYSRGLWWLGVWSSKAPRKRESEERYPFGNYASNVVATKGAFLFLAFLSLKSSIWSPLLIETPRLYEIFICYTPHMNLIFIFSILVTVFSLALTLIGIPAQIAKNYREKRSGQPLSTILIALAFYISQIGFFILTKAYLPLFSFIVGFFMWGTTLVQYFIYKKN